MRCCTTMNRPYMTTSRGLCSSHPVHYSMASSSNTRLRRSSQPTFRNRRDSYLPPEIHKRNFFGMGEIAGVLANPAETVRSLTESKRLLDEARREISDNRERSQLRPKHTFSRLPGFFPRKAETQAIERALEGEPSFTVLFGASSVGKTALLREVLSQDKYHVLHFDLRIAGFADLGSLYTSLSEQMELYFEEISKNMEGYGDFEKEAWSFKHDRIGVERRISEAPEGSKAQNIKPSDIARLMELFQSSLLKYWEFQPCESSKRSRRQDSDTTASSDKTRVEPASLSRRWTLRNRFKGKEGEAPQPSRATPTDDGVNEKEKEKPMKRMPVIFFDEAHKLPALIQSTDAMKCLLDSMLVLTKQDRLCHVIHATSDPFYQTWLRQLNVMQHCKIITIGDCSKAETRAFFRERLLPRIPEQLRLGLEFESLFEAFGGKFAHWHDYITDYVNANGNMELKQSSHFLQAHSLLNLHIIHSSQASPPPQEADTTQRTQSPSHPETIHPGLGPAGFKIYPHIVNPQGPSSQTQVSLDDRSITMTAGYYCADFSAMQLLKVMSRLTQPDAVYLPYFLLCRELGVRAVDGMVKGRVLDLRWTEPITKEIGEEPRVRSGTAMGSGLHLGAGSSGTAVELIPSSEEGGMVAVSEQELGQSRGDVYEEELVEIVGPKLVPMTPIIRFAMREVVQEYEDNQSVSEYASLSDVDEY